MAVKVRVIADIRIPFYVDVTVSKEEAMEHMGEGADEVDEDSIVQTAQSKAEGLFNGFQLVNKDAMSALVIEGYGQGFLKDPTEHDSIDWTEDYDYNAEDMNEETAKDVDEED